jgi:uncharacterized protein (TIGR00255 family)
MTGHGQGLTHQDQLQVLTEVRSVNNRFLKININSDLDAELQSRVEEKVRKALARGSVSVRIKVDDRRNTELYQLNMPAILAYREQLGNHTDSTVPIESLLTLPGVVNENSFANRGEEWWPVVEQSVDEALTKLTEMRNREGKAMQEDMKSNCQLITSELAEIEKMAPEMSESFSKRLTDRINGLLEKFDVNVQPSDVIREVGIFAERADISEEVVRLQSHLVQFDEIIAAKTSNGRKLDFLIQEMLRETNTIGSKASHAKISTHVVEIKTLIERLREMVQNVE